MYQLKWNLVLQKKLGGYQLKCAPCISQLAIHLITCSGGPVHHGQLYPGPPAPGYLAPLPGFATVYNAPAEDSALHGDDWLLERANMIGKIDD